MDWWIDRRRSLLELQSKKCFDKMSDWMLCWESQRWTFVNLTRSKGAANSTCHPIIISSHPVKISFASSLIRISCVFRHILLDEDAAGVRSFLICLKLHTTPNQRRRRLQPLKSERLHCSRPAGCQIQHPADPDPIRYKHGPLNFQVPWFLDIPKIKKIWRFWVFLKKWGFLEILMGIIPNICRRRHGHCPWRYFCHMETF